MATSLLRRAGLFSVWLAMTRWRGLEGFSVIFPEILKQYVIASGVFEMG